MTDASYALSDYIQSLDNLPSELQHIYEELGTRERQFLAAKRAKDARENQIFRHIRQHGGHTANPAEEKYNESIEKYFVEMEKIQEEKCILADKAKELMDRHLNRLNLEIKRLEEEGQIVPLPSTNPPGETNGTATPTGTPSALQQVAVIASQVLQVPASVPRSAPPPQRSVSQPGLTLPSSGLVSQTGTPTPSARSAQKRKAAIAFRRESSADEPGGDEDSQLYCFCQAVSYGDMVACDNENCEREWFHYPCVGLTSPPVGAWYCRECQAKMAGQKQRQPEKKKVVK